MTQQKSEGKFNNSTFSNFENTYTAELFCVLFVCVQLVEASKFIEDFPAAGGK